MMMRVICFALLLACVSAGSVRLRTKETELGHDSSPYAGCDVFLTQMIQLTRDYETQPQDAQIKSCDTLEAHTEQCKALVSRYGLAPMHHLAAFRPDVMCSFFRGEQINDASAEERAQADGGKSDDILMSATDADDDSDSDDDEDDDSDDSDSDSSSNDDDDDDDERDAGKDPVAALDGLGAALLFEKECLDLLEDCGYFAFHIDRVARRGVRVALGVDEPDVFVVGVLAVVGGFANDGGVGFGGDCA
eukprot:comp15037_c0_seq1/m.22355 comp15037_c0_seq1/g.22355  ORF comp15037_c0_seq1/g.22355 comp15037_c0_seq1/m.22355 type:complete len:248 (+) comp15037_c0_seq1:48-791(+)